MSMLSKTITALPLALMLLAGAAAAQSQTSNGGGGSSNSGGEGANSGVAAQMNCLTGAYCPPNRYPPAAYNDSTSCDQVRVRERIPGTNRYRVAYRCQWDRWGY